jgi:hypothetical protein
LGITLISMFLMAVPFYVITGNKYAIMMKRREV